MIVPSGKQTDSKTAPPANETDALLPQEPLPAFAEAVAGSSRTPSSTPAASRSEGIQQALTESIMSDAPPEFSKWDAQYSLTSKGDIYSHDPHLNEDGEALYRFILEHLEAPNFKLHCRGTHKEVRLRVSHHHHHDMHAHSGGHGHGHGHGHNHGHGHGHGHGHHGTTITVGGSGSDWEEVTITDFDFYIDLTPLLAAQRAEIWTADPSVPAYRGSMYREVSKSTPLPAGTPATSRRASRRESRSARRERGRPNAFNRLGEAVRGEGRVRLPDAEQAEGERDDEALLAPSADNPAGAPLDAPSNAPEYSVSAQRTQSPFRSAASAETKRAKQFKEWVTMKGLPPWTPMSAFIAAEGGGAVQATSDQGSRDELKRDVREWADDYCASRKILKDFKFQKVVYGWDLGALKTSIETLIRSTTALTPAPILSPFLPTSTSSPGQDISITFETTASRINIRPDHPLSHALSHTWVVIILWMTLIYPFLWLWRRYDSMGGGRWEICGAAWALKSTPSTGTSTGAQGESEGKYGMKEGEWFRAWEGTIVQAVRAKIQSPQPLMMMSTADGSLSPGATLDGY